MKLPRAGVAAAVVWVVCETVYSKNLLSTGSPILFVSMIEPAGNSPMKIDGRWTHSMSGSDVAR